jgi:hypothetical protein
MRVNNWLREFTIPIPGAVDIVTHEIEPINMFTHACDIKPSKIPYSKPVKILKYQQKKLDVQYDDGRVAVMPYLPPQASLSSFKKVTRFSLSASVPPIL